MSKYLGISTLGVLLVALVIVVGVLGYRLVSLVGASPVLAQIIEGLALRIVQTDTQVLVLDNPLVNEGGVGVDELTDERDKWLGVKVTTKGAVGEVVAPWGFELDATDGSRSDILIITNSEIANQAVEDFNLDGLEYLKVVGTVKELVRSQENSLEEVEIEDGMYEGRNQRLVIVAESIEPIFINPEVTEEVSK